MIEVIDISVEKTIPTMDQILRRQGIPEPDLADKRILKIAEAAIADYRAFAQPIGIIADVSNGDFEGIYRGEGENEDETPLDLIYPEAFELTLFAITIGEGVSTGIELCFAKNDFAAGSMLDTAASEGAELAAAFVESLYKERLAKEYNEKDLVSVMRFSPGYCGWHISGQKRLFEALQPDKIGIELSQSFLMQPIKSISGVMVAGPLRLFEFEDNFRFCAKCDDHSCLERIKSIEPLIY